MATFRSRFASPREMFYVFMACAFPVHVWAIVNMMREVPSWILRLSVWDMVGVIAYSQLFALIETVTLFLGLLLVGAVLPARLFRAKFVPIGSTIVFLTSAWLVFLHYNGQLISMRQGIPLLLWIVSYILVFGLAYFMIQRNPKLEQRVNVFVERLVVLSILYIFIDFLSIIIVIVRNV